MRFRTSLLTLLMAAAPIALWADNPHILIKGDPTDPTIVPGTSFGFGADGSGGGDFSFQNESGQNWLQLTVTALLSSSSVAITCGPGPFDTCTISNHAATGGFLYDIVFGPVASGGITNGEIFSIDLNNSGTDPSGSGSWPANQDFGAQANATVPEPSAVLLVVAGGLLMAGVFRYRRRPLAG